MAKRKAPQAKSQNPGTEPKVTLEELITRITPENRHEAFDWGPPVGKEIW